MQDANPLKSASHFSPFCNCAYQSSTTKDNATCATLKPYQRNKHQQVIANFCKKRDK